MRDVEVLVQYGFCTDSYKEANNLAAFPTRIYQSIRICCLIQLVKQDIILVLQRGVAETKTSCFRILFRIVSHNEDLTIEMFVTDSHKHRAHSSQTLRWGGPTHPQPCAWCTRQIVATNAILLLYLH